MISFTKEDLFSLAGKKSYDRGVHYVDEVEDLETDGDTIYATVQGSDLYEVRLTVRRGVEGSCDCPWGEEGNFCKHCVAVGLVYLYAQEYGEPVPERLDLRSYLGTLSSAELVGLLTEAAEADPELRRQLALRASRNGPTNSIELS